MMDRKALFAFALIALIFILVPYYYRWIGLAPPASKAPSIETGLSEPQPPAAEVADAILHTPSRNLPLDVEPRDFVVSTPLYNATISSIGGGTIVDFSLNQYSSSDGTPVRLIPAGAPLSPVVWYRSTTGDSVSLDYPFSLVTSLPGDTIAVTSVPWTVEFASRNRAGKEIRRSVTFRQDSYVIDFSTDLSPLRDDILDGKYWVQWAGGLATTERNVKDDLYYFAASFSQGGEITKHSGKEGKPILARGTTGWTAVRSKYFVASFVSPDSSATAAHVSLPLFEKLGNGTRRPSHRMAMELPSGKGSSFLLYLGPLQYTSIKSLGVGLDEVMNFGWGFIRPISHGVLFLLTSLHQWIPNYGVILILFALAAKIVLNPLTVRSYRSTKAMQALQPQLLHLRTKHKSNPQKLNAETLRLYRENKVNPLGGCLPLLLQMPILFALFAVFRSTIELRGAPFMLWIRDLSAPDTILSLPFSVPLYGDQVSVLPILMGITTFVQQKMTMTQLPSQQKVMSYVMTGVFVLLFNGFPSGLNLYYTLFNVLTIAQQKYLSRPASLPSTLPKP